MQITEIQSLNQRRVKISIEDESSFVLYQKEVDDLNLEEGEELSPFLHEKIREEILVPRIKKRALFLLSQMDRTEYQLREKLRQGHYEEDLIQIAVDYVAKFDYIDDLRYAKSYVRCKVETKSKRQLKQELLRKGIEGELIEQAIEEEYTCSEEDTIKKWLEKRNYDPETAEEKARQKMYRFLMGKGFSSSNILHLI